MTLSKLHSTVTQPIIDLFSTANHLFYWPYLLGSVFFAVYFLQKNAIKIKTKFSISQKKELKKDIFWALINIYIFSLLVENIDLWARYIAVDLDLFDNEKDTLKAAGSFWISVLYTLAIAVIYDFLYFLFHYGLHRHKFLWCFHKLHHSAKHLTPFTVLRQNPVETILSIVFITCGFFLLENIMQAALPFYVYEIKIANINIVLFIFFICGYHLRHSGLYFSYPCWLESHLVSPAMHQIHHIKSANNRNKNFGLIFSYWDIFFDSHQKSSNEKNNIDLQTHHNHQ
jgi:sterol desaturase/sphingolipid hydroxylase (fatty acid hydroxylase superfamily)